MFFEDLQSALLETLRSRVRNGEFTERSLAKLAGVSQPHIHNVLKGARILSLENCDQVLRCLHLSLFDLLDRDNLREYLRPAEPDQLGYSYLRVLAGKVGPGCAWPAEVSGIERFPISSSKLSRMIHPVAVVLGGDPRMQPLFSPGDLAVLDQGHLARTEVTPEALYVVKRGDSGLVRRVRVVARSLYLVAQDCLDRPGAWERVSLEQAEITHVIRARLNLLGRGSEWERTEGRGQ